MSEPDCWGSTKYMLLNNYYVFCAQGDFAKLAVLEVDNSNSRFRLSEHWDDGKIKAEINVGASSASVITSFAFQNLKQIQLR